MAEARTVVLASDEFHSVQGADLLLRLRLQPRASRETIDTVHAGRLRVRVFAPPLQGAANASVLRLLAHALGVPRDALALLRGEKSRDKEILVRNGAARAAELIARLRAFEK